MDEGALVPACDPDSNLVLSPSWRTSKGTPGTPVIYSSVVFPSLLLLLLLLLSLDPLKLLRSVYSSMALSTLSLDEERTIDIFYGKFKRKLGTKIEIYLDLGRGKLMDAGYF